MSDDEIARMSWEGCPHQPDPPPVKPPPPEPQPPLGPYESGCCTAAAYHALGLAVVSASCAAGYLVARGGHAAAAVFALAAAAGLLGQCCIFGREARR